MTDRGTCWSITINNPQPTDLEVELPAGWKLTGQMEIGEEEKTTHYQGMLSTPQVRFSAVKKVFQRAHIELARNKQALAKYVHKDDTRVAEVPDVVSRIPTLFDYQHVVAAKWDDSEWEAFRDSQPEEDLVKHGIGEIALKYVDTIVSKDIEEGIIGVEYIGINPMWRSAWKKFWKQMVVRERRRQKTDRQTDNENEIIISDKNIDV